MNFEKNDGKNHRIFILNLPNVSRVLLVDFLGEVFLTETSALLIMKRSLVNFAAGWCHTHVKAVIDNRFCV